MKTILFRAVLAGLCLLALQTGPVFAQALPLQSSGVTRVDGEGLIIATCRRGEGCHCYQSNHSLETLETFAQVSPPEGVTNPVLVRTDDGVFWSRVDGHAVDMTFGGDGLCDPQIFPAEETGLPRNGPWAMTIEGNTLAGCPSQVAAAISGDIGLGRVEERVIDWPRPFSMAPLTADNPTAGPWVNEGGGRWSNTIFNTAGQTGGNASVIMTAQIVSPTEIAVTSTFSMDALAIINNGQICRSTTQASLRYRG
ncbi:hypothetical protein [Ponticoccus alexandrii]|uniref:Secreted protein n=1 Tax=Ponticoccus alexandrii TaxID=1943633 RepID=A0ABX7FCC7_9RHOB|nr:hypothetical protein [Ponticoccus alexandrii]ETA52323.1 hypothetical protein P279_09370 [Rhodobacteraceae bacterium PD-2]QRF67516.1 hypothetical protein GQA70_15080 [Ponticoccus alexandrii]